MFKIRALKKDSDTKNENSFYSKNAGSKNFGDSLFIENSNDEIKDEEEIMKLNEIADSEETERDGILEGLGDMKNWIVRSKEEGIQFKIEEEFRDNWNCLASSEERECSRI